MHEAANTFPLTLKTIEKFRQLPPKEIRAEDIHVAVCMESETILAVPAQSLGEILRARGIAKNRNA